MNKIPFLGERIRKQAAISVAFFVIIAVAGGRIASAAWAPPTEPPPGGNVAAPLNVSGAAQAKQGSLTIGGDYLTLTSGNFLVQQSGSGIYWGSTALNSEPHINFSEATNNLYVSAGDSGTMIEVQGDLQVNRASGNQGSFEIYNSFRDRRLTISSEDAAAGVDIKSGASPLFINYDTGQKVQIGSLAAPAELCLNDDPASPDPAKCITAWPTGGGGEGYFSLTGVNLYPTDPNNNLALGSNNAGGYKLQVTGNVNVTGSYFRGGLPGVNGTCAAGEVIKAVRLSGGIVTAATCADDETSGGGGSDTFQVKADAGDTRPDFLFQKVGGGAGITVSVNPGGSNPFVQFDSLWEDGQQSDVVNPVSPDDTKVAIGRDDISDNTQVSIRNAGVGANDKALYAEQAGSTGWAGYFAGDVAIDGRTAGTSGLRLLDLANCNGANTLDTNAQGYVVCGPDQGGGGGTDNFTVKSNGADTDNYLATELVGGTNVTIDTTTVSGDLRTRINFNGATGDTLWEGTAGTSINPVTPATTKVGIGLTNPTGKFVVNHNLAGVGSPGDAIAAYVDSDKSGIYAQQFNGIGFAGYFSGRVGISNYLQLGTDGGGNTYVGGNVKYNGTAFEFVSPNGAYNGGSGNPSLGTVLGVTSVFTVRTARGNFGGDIDPHLVERFRIANDGKVGIGTASPNQELSVSGDLAMSGNFYKLDGTTNFFTNSCTGANLSIKTINADGTMTCETDDIGGGGGGDNLGNHTATQNLRLSGFWLSNDGESEGVFVDTDGKVGVATSSPSSRFEVLNDNIRVTRNTSTNDTEYGGVQFGNVAGFASNWWSGIRPYQTSGYDRNGLRLYTSNAVAAAVALDIMPDGSLRGNQLGAIRIAAPTGYLDVGSKNSSYAHLETDRARFYFNKKVISAGEFSSYSTNDLILQTGEATRLTVLGNNATFPGSIGVANTTPNSLLTLASSGTPFATHHTFAAYNNSNDAARYNAIHGVKSGSSRGSAVYGELNNVSCSSGACAGIYGSDGSGGTGEWAGYFDGPVNITGNLTVNSERITSSCMLTTTATPFPSGGQPDGANYDLQQTYWLRSGLVVTNPWSCGGNPANDTCDNDWKTNDPGNNPTCTVVIPNDPESPCTSGCNQNYCTNTARLNNHTHYYWCRI